MPSTLVDLIRYTDPHWKFSFPVPASWEPFDDSGASYAAILVGPEGYEGFRPNLVATIEQGVGTLEEWQQEAERNIADSVPLWLVLERRPVDQPHPTLLTTATLAGPAGESLTQQAWAVVCDGIGFTLTATCHTADFPALRATFALLFADVQPPRQPEGEA